MIAVLGVALPLLQVYRLDRSARRAFQRQRQRQQEQHQQRQQDLRSERHPQVGRGPRAGPWLHETLDLLPLVPFSGFVLLDLYLVGTLVWTLVASPAPLAASLPPFS